MEQWTDLGSWLVGGEGEEAKEGWGEGVRRGVPNGPGGLAAWGTL